MRYPDFAYLHVPGASGESTGAAGLAAQITHDWAFQAVGIILTVLVTFIGVRMTLYWSSFLFQPGRYRRLSPVSTAQLRLLARDRAIPFVKVQVTTLGSPGSSEVILRGLRQLERLAAEDPVFYASFLSAEVVTENPEQAQYIADEFAFSPVRVDCIATPASYRTPRGTQLKARQLHYLVELRRRGWNARPGRTFIVHWDEDTLMVPDEFRKMIAHLAVTDRKVLTGPIYYPLEHTVATRLARVTEATRPITCFECRRVMETGVPLHVHGSNIVVEEELENRVGWDIGTLDGEPFVAEDYMFGMDVFLKEGREAFGWHGCVALEQPPFSFPSVYRQRYRWVFGVLQGMSVDTKLAEFRRLPWPLRAKVVWGTRYRISTYALGTLVGALSLLFLPTALLVTFLQLRAGQAAGVSPLLDGWFAAVGVMWLGTSMMGAWMNVQDSGYRGAAVAVEILRAIIISPVAGLMENMAAMMAVVKWACGVRSMVWHSTPSTKEADDALRGRAETERRPLADTVTEALMPVPARRRRAPLALAAALAAALAVVAAYIGVPVMLTVQDLLQTRGVAVPAAVAAALLAAVTAGMCARIRRLTRPAVRLGRHELGSVPVMPPAGSPLSASALASTQPYPGVRDTVPLPKVLD